MSNVLLTPNSFPYLLPKDSNRQTLRLSTDVNNNYQILSNNSTITSSGYVTRSKRAELMFSVSRVENNLRKGRYADRINQTASVCLAGVLEYLAAETLELAGELTRQSKRKRITPRDIFLAINNDDELAKLCSNVTIPGGGVVPHIHQILLQTKRRGRRKRQVKFSQTVTEYPSSTANNSIDENSVDMDTDGYLSSNPSDVDDTDVQME